jgi:hypothetical protein
MSFQHPQHPPPSAPLDDPQQSGAKGSFYLFPLLPNGSEFLEFRGSEFSELAAWIPALCQVAGTDLLQRHLLSARLLEFLIIGESVTEASGSLKQAQEAVAKIVEQGHQKAKCEIR